jgi:hypothetical protein
METLALDAGGQPISMSPVSALAGFAEQWQAPLTHPSITVQTAGLNPKRIPLPFVSDHVWTIVIVRESTHRTEIHRYLRPLVPIHPFDDTIRLVEQNWRALEARTPLDDDELTRLRQRDLDPLSLALLGYRLARAGRLHDVEQLVPSVLNAGLTDGHVLGEHATDVRVLDDGGYCGRTHRRSGDGRRDRYPSQRQARGRFEEDRLGRTGERD